MLVSVLQKSGILGFAAAATFAALMTPVSAGEAWDEIKPAIFGDRPIFQALGKSVEFTTPYRSTNDSIVPISVQTRFTDGRSVKSVTFVIDENPMPVTAVFEFDKKSSTVTLSANMRFNGPSPTRVIVETNDGQLHMQEAYVKTTGQGACASPPVNIMTEENGLGEMQFADLTKRPSSVQATLIERSAKLRIQHPNLTGLQLDQVTLLYIPARYVDEIEVQLGDEHIFTMRGGISLSENPEIAFSYRANGANMMNVRVKDTDGTRFERKFPIGAGS